MNNLVIIYYKDNRAAIIIELIEWTRKVFKEKMRCLLTLKCLVILDTDPSSSSDALMMMLGKILKSILN